jgi:hypothetical protein
MKRAALIAGISIAALLCAGTEPSSARTRDLSWSRSSSWSFDIPSRKSKRHASRSEGKLDKAAEKAPPPPSGPLHIIVSIDHQRATLYADGVPVGSTAISSGTPSHPTPMGVFTVIQKDRYHISNLYDAAMPYMQRITWSGSALHQGPLPGYPASHGCVRLTAEFAQLLWRSTKLGARVIVTRPNVVPLSFESPWLALLKPKPAPQPQAAEPALTSALVKTADATKNVPVQLVQHDDTHPLEPVLAGNSNGDQPTKLSVTGGHDVETQAAEAAKPVELAAPSPIIVESRPATAPATVVPTIKNKPISVFVSLKEGRLYVRQGWQALFDSPVTIANQTQPIGTHVYTAMGLKADGNLRWTVVTIPSGYKRVAELRRSERSRNTRDDRTPRPAEETHLLPSPGAALDRITIPPDLADRIAQLMMPGSSLIVSDNKLSDETNESTDFIVLTR